MLPDAEILLFREPWLGETDVRLLREGRHLRPWEKLSAHPCALSGVVGAALAVWAPNAKQPFMVGDSNGWDPQQHVVRGRSECGAWEYFVPCVADMGFTHIELMPLHEHRFYGSRDYQPSGLYALTARCGAPYAFCDFVSAVPAAGLQVLQDWVPAHFPEDAHALTHLDGTAQFETADPCEVVLPVDALVSMRQHHDGGRPAGGRNVPNQGGGRENYEVVNFLREMNNVREQEAPGATTAAKEPTAFPGVTAPPSAGGLGFYYKLNLGWVHDALTYVALDPVHRSHHQDRISLAMRYADSEYFVLALSHNEVVHGKGSLYKKIWGVPWQKRANLRAVYTLMYAHPSRKLQFMGSELAQTSEGSHDGELDWYRLDKSGHAGVQRLVRDLNHVYGSHSALHARDDEPEECHGIDVQDTGRRLGVPQGGVWKEVLNTDSTYFGGRGVVNDGAVVSEWVAWQGYSNSVVLNLPPLGVLWLELGAVS